MNEIPKAYEPQSVEDKWYDFWLKQGCFTADPARVTDKRPAYSIVIPPPNVTGMLHMGHVLNNTIQDILSRKARMDGKEVLWLPGTDHAGIATQVQVEKQIKKEEHKSKYDLGREEFLKRVWTWKEEKGGIIINQLKKLGCSCDWTRERFTMDTEYSACVQKVFVDLYRKGLIYRGKRMVNWCPASLTAVSDEEVEMESQKGFLYYFRVEVAETPGTFLTIATTRPETIPGDTAIAVNPRDPRYAKFIGQHAIRPLPAEYSAEKKLIPIIGDDHVDFEFGTGVLKVTPAHDKADFEIFQRIQAVGMMAGTAELALMQAIEVIDERGNMTDAAGADLKGLERFKARKVAVEKLRELNLLDKEEPYENKVGFSQRARVPIEPRLSEQWFLKYPSVELSKATVASGAMKFHPDRWAKVYDHWLTNIQDWCISRQLWWGHRIPVWSLKFTAQDYKDLPETVVNIVELICRAANTTPPGGKFLTDVSPDAVAEAKHESHELAPTESLLWNAGRSEDSAVFFHLKRHPGNKFELAAATSSAESGKEIEPLGFTQDTDVLDTWFSSWLWPFATMGWPENTETLKKFYPTTDLVTGPDIIFFWVARMIMAGYEFMGDTKFALPDAMPFKNVYFTGIIRDKQGRKMSKTLGNSPDPLVLISQYGADALRFGTMRSAPLGQDVLFDEKDVELGRNFCNKLWNACRFRQMQGGEVQNEINSSLLTTDDKWILLKLNEAIREITEALDSYNFSVAVQGLYRFFWNEYCDWYVEASKAVLTSRSRGDETQTSSEESQRLLTSSPTGVDEVRKANTLAVIDFVLSHTIRLFHPFLPFITEELWHGMGYATDMPEHQGGKTIMFAPWPKPFDNDLRDAYSLDDCYLEFATQKYEVVTQGRNLRRVGNIQAGKKVKFVLKPNREVLPHDAEVIRILLNAEAIEINESYAAKKGTPTAHTPFGELFLPLDGLIDVEAEKVRLTKELEKISTEIGKVEQKLANPAFTQKVPASVLQEHQQRLTEWQGKLAHVKAALEALAG